jgi:hypothetical protein
MEKKYLVGGLAIVGAIALFMYLKPKNKANSEGFYGANGKGGSTSKAQNRVCRICDGGQWASNGICGNGTKCRSYY